MMLRPSDPLQALDGVGPSLAADLRALGFHDPADLHGQDPEQMYADLCELTGKRQDPCVLYVFRCAVHQASTPQPDPESCKWWNWKGRTL